MKHIKAIALKFSVSLFLLSIILGMIFGIHFINIFNITVLLVIFSYILGDLVILPKSNNAKAALADLGLAFLIIWFFSSILTNSENLFTISLIAAIGIALFEYFFHTYLKKDSPDKKQNTFKHSRMRYSTEISEEITPPGKIKKDNEE